MTSPGGRLDEPARLFALPADLVGRIKLVLRADETLRDFAVAAVPHELERREAGRGLDVRSLIA